jgi:hypothetical protein
MYQRAHLKCNFMQTHNKKQTATCRRGQGRIQTHPTPQSRSWSSKIRDRTCVTRPSELRERKMVTMLCVLQSSSVCTHTHTHTHIHTQRARERETQTYTHRERERDTHAQTCVEVIYRRSYALLASKATTPNRTRYALGIAVGRELGRRRRVCQRVRRVGLPINRV